MAHLELLMQKGEIQGPPYIMPDDTELTFLRRFIERQAAGIPHNPRLRHAGTSYQYPPEASGSSPSPDASDNNYLDQSRAVMGQCVCGRHEILLQLPPDSMLTTYLFSTDVPHDTSNHHLIPQPTAVSPSLRTHEALAQEANGSSKWFN